MRCINCFSNLNEQGGCVVCAYDQNESGRDRRALPIHCVLADKYSIGRVLGVGGFGITYLALDLKLNRRVALKEYLPNELAARSRDGVTVRCHSSADETPFNLGLGRFFREGEVIARFDHPNIVRAFEVFEANGTAYLAMEYLEGRSVRMLLNEKGCFSEQQTLDLMTFVLDALKVIHQKNVVHRDLKPDNIYVTNEGRTLLLDFGGAKDIVGEHSQSMMAIFSHGYAAPEQYHGNESKAGPWTDIYGAAALFFKLVTGLTPASALERYGEDHPLDWSGRVVGPSTQRAITHAMALKSEDRPQSVEQFQKELAGNVTEIDSPRTGITKKWVLGVLTLVLVVGITYLVANLTTNGQSHDQQNPISAVIQSGSKKTQSPDGSSSSNGGVVAVIPPTVMPKTELPSFSIAQPTMPPVSAAKRGSASSNLSRDSKLAEEQLKKESEMISAILDEGEGCFAAKKFDCAISSANAALRIKQGDGRAISLKDRASAGQKMALESVTIQ